MKTIALSEEVYVNLLNFKHKLEKNAQRTLSFSEVIENLLKKGEKDETDLPKLP
ncbi:MAG: antitoxin VapB family protein [Candidatus Aenigmatarchaeota archaeon]